MPRTKFNVCGLSVVKKKSTSKKKPKQKLCTCCGNHPISPPNRFLCDFCFKQSNNLEAVYSVDVQEADMERVTTYV